jgi:glycosyltransferase involved in cell wall biosynthesis
MKILCCMVTHNRLEYTQRAIDAFLATSDDPLIVIDNASTDGTEKLAHIRNRANLFPGAATNIGWHEGLKLHPDATHLMRLDNDFELLPGWREEVERCFDRVPTLALLGFHNRHEDYDGNPPVELDFTETVNIKWDQVGGNSIIPRKLYDRGLRWEGGPWHMGAVDEDSIFAAEIRRLGGLVGTVVPTIANNMSFHRYEDYPAYYQETARIRGLVPELSV